MRPSATMHDQNGVSMIEVLVTIVILAFGMLGLIGLQSRLQVSQMESYQRAQALILLDDMTNRITTNRNYAANYVTGTSTPLGTGHTCTSTSSSTRQVQDSCEWNNELLGAAETSGSTQIGAMIGARGCVESLGSDQYMITVAWQGMGPVSAPPASVGCGKDLYDSASGAVCTNDRCRRVVTTVIRIGTLS